MLDFARAEKEKEKDLPQNKKSSNPEEEDDEDDEEINLRPSRFLLTLNAYTYSKVRKYDEWVLDHHTRFYNAILGFIFCFWLAQSLFYYLIVEDGYSEVKPVFGCRIGFLGALLVAIFGKRWLLKKRIIRQYNIIIFLYAITVSLVQAYYTTNESWQKIQLIESFLLYLCGTHVK